MTTTQSEPQLYQIEGTLTLPGQQPRRVIGSRLSPNDAEAVGMFIVKHQLKHPGATITLNAPPTPINPQNN